MKVDDTDTGIEAGLHAGCWTVGVAKTVSISTYTLRKESGESETLHEIVPDTTRTRS